MDEDVYDEHELEPLPGLGKKNFDDGEVSRIVRGQIVAEAWRAQRKQKEGEALFLQELVPMDVARSTFQLPVMSDQLKDGLPLDHEVNPLLKKQAHWAPPSYLPTDSEVEKLGIRLDAVETDRDGNCLLHAVSLALWGGHDRTQVLRDLMVEVLNDNASRAPLEQVWREGTKAAAARGPTAYSLEEDQLEEEWTTLMEDARTPGAYLSAFHVFVLANALRRPLIVYADRYLRGADGTQYAPSDMIGVYLPSMLPEGMCYKVPLMVGYTCLEVGNVGHFSALVGTEGRLHHVPLVDEHGTRLPVRYGILGGEKREEEAIDKYMDMVTFTTNEGEVYRLAVVKDLTMIPESRKAQQNMIEFAKELAGLAAAAAAAAATADKQGSVGEVSVSPTSNETSAVPSDLHLDALSPSSPVDLPTRGSGSYRTDDITPVITTGGVDAAATTKEEEEEGEGEGEGEGDIPPSTAPSTRTISRDNKNASPSVLAALTPLGVSDDLPPPPPPTPVMGSSRRSSHNGSGGGDGAGGEGVTDANPLHFDRSIEQVAEVATTMTVLGAVVASAGPEAAAAGATGGVEPSASGRSSVEVGGVAGGGGGEGEGGGEEESQSFIASPLARKPGDGDFHSPIDFSGKVVVGPGVSIRKLLGEDKAEGVSKDQEGGGAVGGSGTGSGSGSSATTAGGEGGGGSVGDSSARDVWALGTGGVRGGGEIEDGPSPLLAVATSFTRKPIQVMGSDAGGGDGSSGEVRKGGEGGPYAAKAEGIALAEGSKSMLEKSLVSVILPSSPPQVPAPMAGHTPTPGPAQVSAAASEVASSAAVVTPTSTSPASEETVAPAPAPAGGALRKNSFMKLKGFVNRASRSRSPSPSSKRKDEGVGGGSKPNWIFHPGPSWRSTSSKTSTQLDSDSSDELMSPQPAPKDPKSRAGDLLAKLRLGSGGGGAAAVGVGTGTPEAGAEGAAPGAEPGVKSRAVTTTERSTSALGALALATRLSSVKATKTPARSSSSREVMAPKWGSGPVAGTAASRPKRGKSAGKGSLVSRSSSLSALDSPSRSTGSGSSLPRGATNPPHRPRTRHTLPRRAGNQEEESGTAAPASIEGTAMTRANTAPISSGGSTPRPGVWLQPKPREESWTKTGAVAGVGAGTAAGTGVRGGGRVREKVEAMVVEKAVDRGGVVEVDDVAHGSRRALVAVDSKRGHRSRSHDQPRSRSSHRHRQQHQHQHQHRHEEGTAPKQTSLTTTATTVAAATPATVLPEAVTPVITVAETEPQSQADPLSPTMGTSSPTTPKAASYVVKEGGPRVQHWGWDLPVGWQKGQGTPAPGEPHHGVASAAAADVDPLSFPAARGSSGYAGGRGSTLGWMDDHPGDIDESWLNIGGGSGGPRARVGGGSGVWGRPSSSVLLQDRGRSRGKVSTEAMQAPKDPWVLEEEGLEGPRLAVGCSEPSVAQNSSPRPTRSSTAERVSWQPRSGAEPLRGEHRDHKVRHHLSSRRQKEGSQELEVKQRERGRGRGKDRRSGAPTGSLSRAWDHVQEMVYLDPMGYPARTDASEGYYYEPELVQPMRRRAYGSSMVAGRREASRRSRAYRYNRGRVRGRGRSLSPMSTSSMSGVGVSEVSDNVDRSTFSYERPTQASLARTPTGTRGRGLVRGVGGVGGRGVVVTEVVSGAPVTFYSDLSGGYNKAWVRPQSWVATTTSSGRMVGGGRRRGTDNESDGLQRLWSPQLEIDTPRHQTSVYGASPYSGSNNDLSYSSNATIDAGQLTGVTHIKSSTPVMVASPLHNRRRGSGRRELAPTVGFVDGGYSTVRHSSSYRGGGL